MRDFPGPPPQLAGIRYVSGLDQPAGLVALLPGCDPDAVFTRLAEFKRLAVPIANFTGGNSARSDFAASFPTEQSFIEALESTQRIRRLLNGLLLLTGDADRDQLLTLGLAFSRGASIEPEWDPAITEFIDYPMMSGLDARRAVLEQLAQSGLLSRKFFERLHLCGHCGSSRLAAREVCVGCGSANMREEALVHHYRCAHQAPRSRFQDGQNLTCPKCSRILRHYGVDYDTPSKIHLCKECNEVVTEPDVSFACVDCGTHTSGNNTGTCDWHGYSLAPEGERAVVERRLPDPPADTRVSIMMVGHNEGAALPAAIRGLEEQSLSNLQIIVVDDGSTDDMFEVGQRLRAQGKIKTIVATQLRGGKAAALNLGFQFCDTELMVVMDVDTSLDRDAVARVIAPMLANPACGAVSGNIAVRNAGRSLMTRFQSLKYLTSITLGRQFISMLDLLMIVSGGFGAFWRSAVQAVGCWDVGPGVNSNLTAKLRRARWSIDFAHDAWALTDVPDSSIGYFRQHMLRSIAGLAADLANAQARVSKYRIHGNKLMKLIPAAQQRTTDTAVLHDDMARLMRKGLTTSTKNNQATKKAYEALKHVDELEAEALLVARELRKFNGNAKPARKALDDLEWLYEGGVIRARHRGLIGTVSVAQGQGVKNGQRIADIYITAIDMY